MPTKSDSLPNLLSVARIRRRHLRKYSWLPDVLRIKGSIITQIIGPVLTVTIWSALVCYADSKGHHIHVSNTIFPLLSVVVGLLLVFRNTTSYDRYWEGRKSFASLTSNVRNLSRLVWVNLGMPPSDDAPAASKARSAVGNITETQLRRRKVDTIKLCLAFSFSVKHYLRGEDGLEHQDYTGLLPSSFARFDDTSYLTQSNANSLSNSYAATGSTPRASSILERDDDSPHRGATKRVRVKRSNPNVKSAASTTPLLAESHTTVQFHDDLSMPLPLIIAYEISRRLYHFRRDGFGETIGPAGMNAMNQIVQSMVDQITAMERIANTPIPAAYGIHLKQVITLYLFCLPFTLVGELGWASIPIVTMIAFTFMGIEGIADDIEMPFGMDKSDLPLDRYCNDLKEEIDYLLIRLPEGGQGSYSYDDGEGDD